MSSAPSGAVVAPGALESAMRIPGAVAVEFGDLVTGRVLGSTARPALASQFPQLCGKAAVALGAGSWEEFAESGERQTVEEVIITGRRYFCMLQAVRPPGGISHAFIQVSLDRSLANLAMARLDLRAIAECLPGVVEHECRTAAARESADADATEDCLPQGDVVEPELLPQRLPGQQLPGSMAARPAVMVGEPLLRQILAALHRYR
ncbi:hypothetical protein [Streptacidiphilus fuscans]|uniref:Uncharacterized protein n=1 Tax=Streptacidiphilus fuscans TaxID=2789292 RepID=A0A931B5B4_9ACTN|nr:hypothetical protein [Streptacidiphilus fuscans]MBF9068937.1 hypothetical protein [Streptacidiphilus fuscans]MBF9073391.1 hypothetical protein [Streptacidiphilus fuscans]